MVSRSRFRPLHSRLAVCFGYALLLVGSSWLTAQRPTSSDELRTSAGQTEVGLLDGAAYRIDIPEGWNHSLVVFYHGYAQRPVTFHIAERLGTRTLPLWERHYAVVQSAYSQPGWALQQAFPETESLRRYFIQKYGHPNETYAAGESMGGALVMVSLELNPRSYSGGLDLCGAVGPTSESFQRRFALRAAFDVYFPGVLPNLLSVPADYEANTATRERVFQALRVNPSGAFAMRSLAGLHNDAELASDMAYFTFVIGEMQHRAGGNPFDNRNWLYAGTNPTVSTGDFELNDKVRRYTALPSARDYLQHHFTPTGRLARPMLALHTLYDPVVPVGQLVLYGHQVDMAGFGSNLVQQYVHREGHCNITREETGRAFDELLQWIHGGQKPVPGLLH